MFSLLLKDPNFSLLFGDVSKDSLGLFSIGSYIMATNEPPHYICENKGTDQLCGNCAAAFVFAT